MITKERLKELIEQGATIYFINSDSVDCKDSKYPSVEVGNNYASILYGGHWHNIDYENLFETEEDAKWELEMTATRTETLKLPTWEEFNKDNFGIKFYNKSREFCLHRVRYSSSDKNPLWKIDLYESYGDDEDTVAWEKSWDLTKENYINACKLCLRLFKGEEV